MSYFPTSCSDLAGNLVNYTQSTDFIGHDTTGSMKYRAAGYLLSRMLPKASEQRSFLCV